MNDDVYRRLCMTSVCGAILIPVAMALVAELAAERPAMDATAVAVASTTASNGTRTGDVGDRGSAMRLSSPDRTTK